MPKLPSRHFGHVPGQIHVGGNALATGSSVMKIENEARIPQRTSHQQTKTSKSRANEGFGLHNPSVNTQFKASFNADLAASPISIPITTNSERKKSLQTVNSMLSAEQSLNVSKRLI